MSKELDYGMIFNENFQCWRLTTVCKLNLLYRQKSFTTLESEDVNIA